MITGKQIKAARALLDWKQDDLANRLDMSVSNIKRIEGDQVIPPNTFTKLIEVFGDAEIAFTPNGGVEVKDDLVKIFEGKDGFIDFFHQAYNYTRKNGGEILASDLDDRMIHNVLGDTFDDHPDRMAKLINFTCRTLIREGDTYSDKHAYSSYVRIPNDLFSNVPYYVFGTSVGIFFWKDSPKILMITDADLVTAYTKQFDFIWNSHKETGDVK